MTRLLALIPLLLTSILWARAAGAELRLTVPTAPADPVVAEGFVDDDLEILRAAAEKATVRPFSVSSWTASARFRRCSEPIGWIPGD